MPAKQVLKPGKHGIESRSAQSSAGVSGTSAKLSSKPSKQAQQDSTYAFTCTEQKTGGWLKLYPVALLAIIWLLAFSVRLFSVIRFEAIIHEFDPWFNYRSSVYMVQQGYYNFLNWFDERAWYPLGRIVGGTVYPGLMLTSGFIHYITRLFTIPISIRDICVFLSPFFSGMTAIATFLFTRELWNTGAGLFAAGFMGIAPGYISRSVAGSYDNEGIAIFALIFVYYLWMKSVATGSVMWSALCAVMYAYMVSAWGGYVYIINLVPLHILVLLLMGRYSNRIYVAYNTFFIMGLLLSMQVPFVGFQPVRTSEHMAAIGVFAVLNAYAFLQYIKKSLQLRLELWLMWLASAGVVFAAVVGLTLMGVIAPWSGRFYSLWDTGYAKIHIPIIASVSEHQPTTWTSFIFDLHFLICAFPAGAFFCVKDINDLRVFIILYALTATYFSGVMVRLVLTLTPVVCVLAGIAVSEICSRYFAGISLKQTFLGGGSSTTNGTMTTTSSGGSRAANLKKHDAGTNNNNNSVSGRLFDDAAGATVARSDADADADITAASSSSSSTATTLPSRVTSKDDVDETGVGMMVRNLVFVCLCALLMLFVMHCTWITSNAYSSPSVVLATYGQNGEREILDDFREAYYWLRMNSADDARVMSWWDYGYQIAGFANRTTLVDNNTWNNSHIAMVGKAMASNETAAYTIMQSLDVDYVLVIFGGLIGYSGDDINKFLWMVRIAEGEHPQDIRESSYFTADGQYRVDSAAPPTMTNSLMYRLSYYRFGEVSMGVRSPAGYDRTRSTEIGKKNIKLKYLEEAFTSEHWLVRVYKVKHVFNRGFKTRPLARVRADAEAARKK